MAIKAAALLSDKTDEVADVINMAGRWVKERDEKLADRYFALLKQRAGSTPIGRAATERRRFVETQGPWSTQLDAEEKQMKKELGLHDPNDELPEEQGAPDDSTSPVEQPPTPAP